MKVRYAKKNEKEIAIKFWKKNVILSLFLGTAIYLVLIRYV